MLLLLLAEVAWPARPQPIVALGDTIVVPEGSVVPGSQPGTSVMPAAPGLRATGAAPAAGGWVAVLADCLEERAPGRFAVVDRASAGETLASVGDKLGAVRDLGPAWVVVTLGARELAAAEADPKVVGAELAALVGKLREGKGASVVVVAPVPAEVGDAERQAAADARVAAFNEAATAQGASGRGVYLVDPLAVWLASSQPRAGLVGAGSLTDPGQAKVAAAVCDVVLAQR